MAAKTGASNAGLIIITSIISIVVTIAIGAVVISQYGTQTVANEVSPFVDGARDRLLEGVVPPTERKEPETEADLIMDGVAKNQGSSVLIYMTDAAEAEFLGRGILVTSNGYILTDATIVSASGTYSVAVPGTKDRLLATVVRTEDDITVLKITISTTLVSTFGRNVPIVNDVVVAVSGDAKMRIGTGIVTESTDTTLTTNIYGTITPGSVLVAKSGYAVGISVASQQKANEPAFKILTKTDIGRLTTIIDSE